MTNGFFGLAIADDEGHVGERIENRVRHGCEERKRARSHGTIYLEPREKYVANEGGVHGDPILELLGFFCLGGFTDMFVDRFEETDNLFILSVVVVGQAL